MKDLVIVHVEVRAALPEQWSRVRDLRLAALADAPDAFASTLAEERALPDARWRARLGRDDSTTFLATVTTAEGVARDAGLVVVATLDGDVDVAGLYSVWVAPWARGRGVGTALLEVAVAHAARRHRRVVLDVGDGNAAAIRLYERLGFVPTGRTSTLPPPRGHVAEHERVRDLGA